MEEPISVTKTSFLAYYCEECEEYSTDTAGLDPIRMAYLNATAVQRPFILANAISYITRGATTKRED